MEETKQASDIQAKEFHILEKEEIRKSNTQKWALEDKKYKWTYNEVAEYLSLSDFEEESNSRYLIHALKLFKGTCNYDDSYKSLIADKLFNSIIDNIKIIDTLTSNFDNQEFICKLESLIDNIE